MSDIKDKLSNENIKSCITLNEEMFPIRIIYNEKEYEINKTRYGMQMTGVKDIDKDEKM